MRRAVFIDELRAFVGGAQVALVREKAEILALYPPALASQREEYAFAYVRAERFGLKAIQLRLAGLAWLPLQIDPSPEMLGRQRSPLNRWILSYSTCEPSAADFGSDLMHSLTRCALRHGWGSLQMLRVTSRISALYHDMSCLLNAAYFLNWFAANNVERLAIDLTGDVLHTVTEMARAAQAPEAFVLALGKHGKNTEKSRRPALSVVVSNKPGLPEESLW